MGFNKQSHPSVNVIHRVVGRLEFRYHVASRKLVKRGVDR